MWSAVGKVLASVLTGVVGALFGWLGKNKLEREAAKGRAAGEYLEAQDRAREEEKRLREIQEELRKNPPPLDPDDIFKTD